MDAVQAGGDFEALMDQSPNHIVRGSRSLADHVDNDKEAGDSVENDNNNIDITAGYEPGNAIL